jgi:trigger factor
MQVTVENSGGLQRKLTVQVPGNEVQQKIDARLREIGKTAKLKGFRPGKIPMKVLQQRYGASVQREILGQTMQDSLQRAIQQEALRLVANPVVDRMPQLRADQDLEFTATLEVYPEVKDIAVKAISLASPETEVTDADIDDMLQTLREQRGSWKLVERSPKDKDHVTFEYSAELADSRFPEEGVKKMSLLMGSSDLDKLEKKLSGMAVDEESEVKQKFPAEFPEKALAGQAAKLSVKLIGVRERNVPELDDEFIKSFSIESGSIDELRTEVRANLERELTGARATYLKMQLLDELLKAQADLAVPESLVREEATAMAQAEARQQGQEQVSKQRVEALLNSARKRV